MTNHSVSFHWASNITVIQLKHSHNTYNLLSTPTDCGEYKKVDENVDTFYIPVDGDDGYVYDEEEVDSSIRDDTDFEATEEDYVDEEPVDEDG